MKELKRHVVQNTRQSNLDFQNNLAKQEHASLYISKRVHATLTH
jgi:hypothetical protein